MNDDKSTFSINIRVVEPARESEAPAPGRYINRAGSGSRFQIESLFNPNHIRAGRVSYCAIRRQKTVPVLTLRPEGSRKK